MMNLIPMMCQQVAAEPISIEQFLRENKQIKESACRVEGDTAIVAILTMPIFTKSERDKLLSQVAKEIAVEFNLSKVIVTSDSEVFCRIELNNTELNKLIALISKRGGYYEYFDNH